MTQDFSTPSTAAQGADHTARLQSLNSIGTISYVLHLIVAIGAVIPGGQFCPVLLIAALVLDLVKRDQAEGTWHASHFQWRIRSVLIAATLYLVTSPLWLLLFIPGWIAWTVVSIWFLYRIVTGFLAMNKGQSMEKSL